MVYFKIHKEASLAKTANEYDGVLVINTIAKLPTESKCPFSRAVVDALACDASVRKHVSVLALPGVPAGRCVLAPVAIDADYDDVRSFRDAAVKCVRRALDAGVRRPLLVMDACDEFADADLVVLLGVFEALHVPIQIRELKPENLPTIEHLGVMHKGGAEKLDAVLRVASALEEGRIIARDIGDGDPERMAPPRVREYVEAAFKETCIKVNVIDDEDTFRREYPLFEAVNRCASVVPRHRGCIIYLEYNPAATNGEVKETLMLVGKGVTYDTGGADIKAGGIMAGMSRDKCGSAAVAGFMKVVGELRPRHVRVCAAMSMVRNSVGSNCYVADELIKARSGQLVRVGNTDAEGRMVMADVLCRMKELAVDMVNPHLFTVATLTGHACLAVGDGYSIVVDNGPARKANVGGRLQKAGDAVGDPFEISTMRREDLAFHRGKCAGDDVMQCNNLPSSRTARGHQTPAAFLLLASGLDRHGSGAERPLKFSHLDIAASSGSLPEPSTGAPVLALAKAFLL